MKTYSVNEIFYSLQGEGVRAGTANVFVRFAGCNLQCSMEPGPLSPGGFDCDTQFTGGLKMTAEDIVAKCRELAGSCRAAIFTGGEPMLQVDRELIEAFGASTAVQRYWHLAVETNGTVPVPDGWFDWVTVSPKVAEHALRVTGANEAKYVIHAGQALPKPHVAADHYLVSPAWSPNAGFDRASVEWCIKLCKENPQWRLSQQLHKVWNVR